MALIPMNQQGELSNKDISLSSSRLCWVLNRDPIHEYKAKYRGNIITVPANQGKIPKKTEEGGNLMNYLEACRFVRDLVEPQGYEMDAGGKPQPIFRNKMLFEQELTKEEFESITGGKLNLQKEAATEERKARRNLTQELTKIPNKIAVADDEDE